MKVHAPAPHHVHHTPTPYTPAPARPVTPRPHPGAAESRFAHDFSRVRVRADRSAVLQAKLTVNGPRDAYEQEADRVAADVMRAPGAAPAQEPRREPVRLRTARVHSGDLGAGTAPPIVDHALSAPGEPLAPAVRQSMETRFGHDFSGVRVHADRTAEHSVQAVNALAYTVGPHVVFGAGRYAPGTAAGDRLLAHELTHVLQQRATPQRVQRQEPKTAAAADPELELGKTLRGPGFSDGYALAFYDENEPETVNKAGEFAARERALGLKGKGVSAANVVVGKAISGVRDVATTVPAIARVVDAALAKVPADPNLPPASAAAPGKVKALAIFAHGTPDWCSLDITTGNAPTIFTTISPHLSSNVRVILYTCNSGRGPAEDEEWVKGTMRGGGEKSLGAVVRDTLADQKLEHGSVWGHSTTGHTSRNFALREFSVDDGKGAEGQSYVAKYVFTASDWTAARADLVQDLTGQGYTVTATDSAFLQATQPVLERMFYGAYAEANRKLPGENVAEDAPMYPWWNAARVSTYFKDVYWPANRAKVAEKVRQAMKLKKP